MTSTNFVCFCRVFTPPTTGIRPPSLSVDVINVLVTYPLLAWKFYIVLRVQWVSCNYYPLPHTFISSSFLAGPGRLERRLNLFRIRPFQPSWGFICIGKTSSIAYEPTALNLCNPFTDTSYGLPSFPTKFNFILHYP